MALCSTNLKRNIAGCDLPGIFVYCIIKPVRLERDERFILTVPDTGRHWRIRKEAGRILRRRARSAGVYGTGLLIMALGIVLIKKANLGMSPISSIPSTAANLTPLTLGQAQTLFQMFCIGLQALILHRVTAALAFQVPLSVVFGWLIDGYMALLPFWPEGPVLRGAVCLLGIGCTALGIVLIVRVDLVLPAPDALIRLVSRRTGRPLGRVKLFGDLLWSGCAAAVEWFALGTVLSVGLGTAASALLTGNLVTLLRRAFPQEEKLSG